MDCGYLDSLYSLFIIAVIFIEYVVNLLRYSSVQMTSIASVHPGRGILLCCSPEGFSSFFPREFLKYFLGVFPDPM